MEAERNRRKQLLDTQAQINVAEGHKQRVILESEGLVCLFTSFCVDIFSNPSCQLEAKSNEADAAFKTVVREAEARKQQAVFEAQAIAEQVESVARALTTSGAEEPSAEQRTAALQTLVELKRLEQLKAIAQSKSNSTYFFGDRAALGGQAAEAFNVDYAQQVKAGIEKKDARHLATGAAST